MAAAASARPAYRQAGFIFGGYSMSVRKMMGVAGVLAVFLLVINVARADLSNSVAYLQSHANNPWVTMALAGAGTAPDTTYLKTLSRTSATDYEASILALTAAGKDPRTYTSEDLIAKLNGFAQANQIGDPKLLNDDFFGVLALISAGVSAADATVAGSVNFIIANQQADGSWSYATDAAYSDPDMTAAAVMALRAAGRSSSDPVITKAVTFLKGIQNSNLNSSSEAWAVSALYSAGENPSTAHLQSLIGSDGKITDSYSDSFAPTGTAYAVVALSGKYYPIGTIAAAPAGVSAKYLIQGSAGTICIGSIQSITAMDIVKNSSTVCGFTYHIKDTSFGPYLDQIGNDVAAGSSGWLYAVNGKAPSVGAGDYKLTEGDGVIWYFGPFDMTIPVMPTTTGIELSATIDPAATQQPLADSVGFEIDLKKIAFGSLRPGSVGTAQFVLKNTGTQPMQFLSSVTGDALFRDYLQLAGALWRQFSLLLGAGQSSTVQAKLPVPASYGSGAKSGTITIWATPAN